MHLIREPDSPRALWRARASLRRAGRRRRGPGGRSLLPLAVTSTVALAVGAALEFFLDPRSGKRRRKLLRDRVGAAARRRRRRIEREAHYEAGKVIGLAHAITHRDHGAPQLDDVSLVRKVESELFRDRSVPKGQISINADRGIVVLRGQLEDPEQIRQIENKARKIAGVRDVENLLHRPGVPVPPGRPHGPDRTARPGA
jgi:hypothetical protein